MNRLEICTKTETKMQRIAWLSKMNPQMHFHGLMHHYNEESLKECFEMLDGKKALGADGINKTEYEIDLEENINTLITKMKRMGYRPGPVREVKIPKGSGGTRSLGISNIEDKIVQLMTARILNNVYDSLFIDDSYGFRPERGCHTAIKALSKYLYRNEVDTVIDIDIANFFGTIDHKLLQAMLEHKIKDFRFIRYIVRMFKAGVLTNGELTINDEGVPQGSICSPILANIFAHYVIDLWMEKKVKPKCSGMVRMFRYADDMIICCERGQDALMIKEALGKRLGEFNLKLNKEKTRFVNFSKAKAGQGVRQGTFDFLGFTFYYGKSRRGYVIPKIKTRGKTMRAKLKRVSEWARKVRNKARLKEIWKMFCRKLAGHTRYYGVSHNTKYIEIFLEKSTRIMFKWLNRRSQKTSFSWEEFRIFVDKNPLPKAKVYVPLFDR